MAKINLSKGSMDVIRELSTGRRAGGIISGIGIATNRRILPGKNGILFKNTPAALKNGFTGIGITKLGIGLIATGMVGMTAKDTYDTVQYNKMAARPEAEDLGSISTMSYDAVGNVNNGRRDLGATGDLVFGLHAANKKY